MHLLIKLGQKDFMISLFSLPTELVLHFFFDQALHVDTLEICKPFRNGRHQVSINTGGISVATVNSNILYSSR